MTSSLPGRQADQSWPEKGQSENRITLVRPRASQGLSILDCPSMSPLATASTLLRPLLVY